MDRTLIYFRAFLVALTLLYAAIVVRDTTAAIQASNGFLLADGRSAAGGDFINLFAAGSLAAAGRISEIYDPKAFGDFERTLIPADIGLRLWAYPPTSLLLAMPFGSMNFWVALASWSALGLAFLAIGARRMGLSWLDTALVAISPASLTCILCGQTGNLAIGLLLIALSACRKAKVSSALAAAMLTLKPQLGLFLPVLWLIQKRFKLIAATTILIAALVGVSIVVWGPGSWVDYVTKTLPVLDQLERTGDGPFVAMIPSVFMSVRIVTQDAELAKWVHIVFAAMVLAAVVLRCVQMRDPWQQGSVALIATALGTPYIHIYDLAGVFCALLIDARRVSSLPIAAKLVTALAVLAAWSLPTITVFGNVFSTPLGPPVLLALLVFVSWPTALERVPERRHALSMRYANPGD